MTAQQGPFSRETPLAEQTGESLRARIVRAEMFLIEMNRPEGALARPSRELVADHAAYLTRLEREGRLFAAGPLLDVDLDAGYELAIVAAASRTEAERVASEDPLARAGMGANRVRTYMINEGVLCYVARAMAKRLAATGETFSAALEDITRTGVPFAGGDDGVEVSLIFLDPTEKVRPPGEMATMDAHFVWLRENEMAARLMACGPLQSLEPLREGVWGGGLGIAATSTAEAKRMAAVEPSGLEGYRTLSVRRWRIDYGLAAPMARPLVTLNSL